MKSKRKTQFDYEMLENRVRDLEYEYHRRGGRHLAEKLAQATAKLIGLCILAGSLSYVVFTVAKLVGWKG